MKLIKKFDLRLSILVSINERLVAEDREDNGSASKHNVLLEVAPLSRPSYGHTNSSKYSKYLYVYKSHIHLI